MTARALKAKQSAYDRSQTIFIACYFAIVPLLIVLGMLIKSHGSVMAIAAALLLVCADVATVTWMLATKPKRRRPR